MLRGLRRFGIYLRGVSLGDKMPVWLTVVFTILAAIGGAGATYWLAPKLNAQFEAAKVKSQYVLENLKLLNGDTANLLADLGEYNRAAIRSGGFDNQLRADINKRLTALQWRAIEYDILFDGAGADQSVKRYRAALEKVRDAVASARQPLDAEKIIGAGEELAVATNAMIKLLSKKADIQAAFRSL